VDPRAGLEAVEKSKKISRPFRVSNTGRPTQSQLLHRLSYPGYGIPHRLEYSNTELGLYVGVLISLWLLLFPIFLFAAQPKEFFLDGLKKLEQGSHKCVELRGEYVEKIDFFNPVAYCFLYKAKDLSAPSYLANVNQRANVARTLGSGVRMFRRAWMHFPSFCDVYCRYRHCNRPIPHRRNVTKCLRSQVNAKSICTLLRNG
jgi:hypothetical protein